MHAGHTAACARGPDVATLGHRSRAEGCCRPPGKRSCGSPGARVGAWQQSIHPDQDDHPRDAGGCILCAWEHPRKPSCTPVTGLSSLHCRSFLASSLPEPEVYHDIAAQDMPGRSELASSSEDGTSAELERVLYAQMLALFAPQVRVDGHVCPHAASSCTVAGFGAFSMLWRSYHLSASFGAVAEGVRA